MSPIALLATWLSGGAALSADTLDLPARDAIVRAVRARMGASADVVVEPVGAPLAALTPGDAIEDAVIEPGATVGGLVRVLLRAPVTRGGATALAPVARLTVRLHIVVDHWHTTRAIARGTPIAAADVRAARHVVTSGALDAPPGHTEVVAATALRDLPANACVTARAVLPMPAVRAGGDVVAVVRAGAMEVRADLVSIDTGRVGAIVRVRHPASKRTLRARVVGRGEVEVNP